MRFFNNPYMIYGIGIAWVFSVFILMLMVVLRNRWMNIHRMNVPRMNIHRMNNFWIFKDYIFSLSTWMRYLFFVMGFCHTIILGVLVWNIGLYTHDHLSFTQNYNNIGIHGKVLEVKSRAHHRWGIIIQGYAEGFPSPGFFKVSIPKIRKDFSDSFYDHRFSGTAVCKTGGTGGTGGNGGTGGTGGTGVCKTGGTNKQTAMSKVDDNSKIRIQGYMGRYVYVRAHMFAIQPTFPIPSKDYAQYYWTEGFAGIGYAISPMHGESKSIGFIQQIRNIITKDLYKHISNFESFAIADDLMTGQRTYLQTRYERDYRISGIAHILAISGLHLGMITLLLIFIGRRIFVFTQPYYYHKGVFLLIFSGLSFFLILVGPAISTLRAFSMLLLIYMAAILGRRVFSRRNVAIIWMMALLIAPSLLFHMGFLLSFFATASLITLYEYILRIKIKYSYINKPPPQSYLIKIIKKLGLYFMGVVTVTLVTLPIFWFFVGHIYSYSIISNFFMIPYMVFVLMPSVLLGYVGIIVHQLWVLSYVGLVIGFMSTFAHIMATLPHAMLTPWALSPVTFLCWMGMYFWIFLFPFKWHVTLGLFCVIGISFLVTPLHIPQWVVLNNSILIKKNGIYYKISSQLNTYDQRLIKHWSDYTNISVSDFSTYPIDNQQNYDVLQQQIKQIQSISPRLRPCISIHDTSVHNDKHSSRQRDKSVNKGDEIISSPLNFKCVHQLFGYAPWAHH